MGVSGDLGPVSPKTVKDDKEFTIVLPRRVAEGGPYEKETDKKRMRGRCRWVESKGLPLEGTTESRVSPTGVVALSNPNTKGSSGHADTPVVLLLPFLRFVRTPKLTSRSESD